MRVCADDRGHSFPIVSPTCSVARRALIVPADERDAAQQRHFEIACARELLGEVD